MTKLGPHGHGQLARYFRNRATELSATRNQIEIAREAVVNPPMLSMIRNGHSKLPLDCVAALARALDVDPKHLWLLALEQQGNASTAKEAARIFGSNITGNEHGWVEMLRVPVGEAGLPPSLPAARAIWSSRTTPLRTRSGPSSRSLDRLKRPTTSGALRISNSIAVQIPM